MISKNSLGLVTAHLFLVSQTCLEVWAGTYLKSGRIFGNNKFSHSVWLLLAVVNLKKKDKIWINFIICAKMTQNESAGEKKGKTFYDSKSRIRPRNSDCTRGNYTTASNFSISPSD